MSNYIDHQTWNDLPVAMHYHTCQRTYHDNVDVFVSHIHGLGLYCLQEIETGNMGQRICWYSYKIYVN